VRVQPGGQLLLQFFARHPAGDRDRFLAGDLYFLCADADDDLPFEPDIAPDLADTPLAGVDVGITFCVASAGPQYGDL
jgi:hypothetical protein